jgi:ArsR family transcriptional regulator
LIANLTVCTGFVIQLSRSVGMSRQMDETRAIAALMALAQPTRLKAFRQLVGKYPKAVAAGEMARHCDVPHNTMSSHLAVLTRAGLLSVTRQSRSMLYSADINGFRTLVLFLARDCCGGRAEICAPLFDPAATHCLCETEPVHG